MKTTTAITMSIVVATMLVAGTLMFSRNAAMAADPIPGLDVKLVKTQEPT
jgi:hypothetical protein